MATAFHGEVLSERFALSDGAVVTVRPIAASDAEALVIFHRGLSDHSVYLRYFTLHRNLSEKEVAHLTQCDGRDRLALVVESDGVLIAVGRYDRLNDLTRAEVAFVVADDFQHHGLATMLLARLARSARQAGITQFTAEVLDENKAMLGVFFHAGYRIEHNREWGTVDLVMDIQGSKPDGLS
jgi:RimJ/RimL family protein N-acetyltransferase